MLRMLCASQTIVLLLLDYNNFSWDGYSVLYIMCCNPIYMMSFSILLKLAPPPENPRSAPDSSTKHLKYLARLPMLLLYPATMSQLSGSTSCRPSCKWSVRWDTLVIQVSNLYSAYSNWHKFLSSSQTDVHFHVEILQFHQINDSHPHSSDSSSLCKSSISPELILHGALMVSYY